MFGAETDEELAIREFRREVAERSAGHLVRLEVWAWQMAPLHAKQPTPVAQRAQIKEISEFYKVEP